MHPEDTKIRVQMKEDWSWKPPRDEAVAKARTDQRLKARKKTKRKARGKKKPQPQISFYASWEWKKVRYETIKRYGPVCMCCGSDEKIVVDHIRPRSRFPELELDLDNLQVLCNDCNMGKSNDDYTDFRPKGTELSKSELIELEIVEEADKWH